MKLWLEAGVIRAGSEGRERRVFIRIVTVQGAVKHVRGVAHVVERVAGRPLFVGALQDVTESKVAEEALRRARSGRTRRVARVTPVSAFTASIAHEVNQPLSDRRQRGRLFIRRMLASSSGRGRRAETTKRTLRDGNRAADVISRLRAMLASGEFALECWTSTRSYRKDSRCR